MHDTEAELRRRIAELEADNAALLRHNDLLAQENADLRNGVHTRKKRQANAAAMKRGPTR